jgi:hypothetical protein
MRASGHNGDIKQAGYGYEPTREAAMQAFARSWHRKPLTSERTRCKRNCQNAIAFSTRLAASNPPNAKPKRRAILLSVIALGS